MAIDYTASNGSPADPRSLHYVDPAGTELNDYAKAMSGIGRVLEFYGENQGQREGGRGSVCKVFVFMKQNTHGYLMG